MKALRFTILFVASLFLASCEDDNGNEQDVAPSVTIIKPAKDVKTGDKIEIELEFADDKGLQHVEVSLGSNDNAGPPYFYTQRGISGLKDKLSIMVDQPSGTDVLGSNYILITCRDKGGNATVVDENFRIVDANLPTGHFIYNDTLASTDTTSRIEVVYKAEDAEGLEKVTLEMWTVDTQGQKIKFLDSSSYQAMGSTSITRQHFFKGKTSFVSGDLFTFFIKIEDESGNTVEVASADIGRIL